MATANVIKMDVNHVTSECFEMILCPAVLSVQQENSAMMLQSVLLVDMEHIKKCRANPRVQTGLTLYGALGGRSLAPCTTLGH